MDDLWKTAFIYLSRERWKQRLYGFPQRVNDDETIDYFVNRDMEYFQKIAEEQRDAKVQIINGRRH